MATTVKRYLLNICVPNVGKRRLERDDEEFIELERDLEDAEREKRMSMYD